MSLAIIHKGEDKEIAIHLQYQGSPLAVSNFVEIVFSVYQTKNEIIQQWKLSNGSLIIVDDAGGFVIANLDRDNTLNLQMKRLYFSVQIDVSDASFEDGVKRFIVSGDLADLKFSV